MQANDSRLIKAAKRTIRAEITLVIIIIIIGAWSVYAVYKLAIGSTDSIFGLNLTKLVPGDREANTKSKTSTALTTINANNNSIGQVPNVIYSQANQLSSPRQSDLNSIGALIAAQNRAHLYTNELISGLDKHRINRIDPRLLQQFSSNNNLYRPSTIEQMIASSQPITPIHQYARGLPIRAAILPPIAADSTNKIGSASNQELNYDQRTLDLNEDDDRQAEESNRDPSESIVNSNEDDPVIKTNDYEESATSGPTIENQNTTESPKDSETNDEDTQTTTQTPDNSDSSNDKAIDDESLKDAGFSVDEEVDRMTQPSFGSVSQEEKPFDYRNAVQFDDSLTSGSVVSKIRPNKKSLEPGNMIARFAEPQKDRDRDTDLQIDHDTVQVDLISEEPDQHTAISNGRSRSNKRSHKSIKDDQKRSNRQKRYTGGVIRAPYEIEAYLTELIKVQSQPTRIIARRSRTLPVDLSDGLEMKPSEQVTRRYEKRLPKKIETTKRKKPVDELRRSDGDNDEDEIAQSGEEEEEETNDSKPERSHDDSHETNSNLPRFHYLSSNDTTLQDLLTRQRLIEALRESQLPAPVQITPQSNQTIGNVSIPSGLSPPSTNNGDHQPSGSLYSVDRGLLLYPSADNEYSSKSMSKKKKKHEKKKEKKKMTVAVKKGGHKKKKHKKEEKKYIKEKKFKGAKKGKKVSKGKGGQGGKKGKKLYKDKGFKKKGFKNVYHKEEFGQKKSYFDEFRDKDFKKKWKKFDDKYDYAQMKKWQAKDVKGAKKMKDHGEKFKKYDKGKWKKKYQKHSKEHSASSKKQKKSDEFD